MTLDDVIRAFQKGTQIQYRIIDVWHNVEGIRVDDIRNFDPNRWRIKPVQINIKTIDELVTLHNKYLATLRDDIDDELHGTPRGLHEYGLKYFVEWLKSR